MANAIVFVPITCPFCRHVTAVPFTRAEIVEQLSSAVPITLYSPCHNHSWKASAAERCTMRDALQAATAEPGVESVESGDWSREEPYVVGATEVSEAANSDWRARGK